jgi:CheY-like chemotaxis protein
MSEDEVTILLVEDNADDEELCVRALRRSHIKNEIVVAHDGVEAVEYLLDQNACDRPHLVLLDLKLPRLDGLQVLERLRADARTRTTPVVVLTRSCSGTTRSSSTPRGGATCPGSPRPLCAWVRSSTAC